MNGSPNCRHSRACAKSALAGILPPRLNKAFAEQFLQATTFAGIAQLVEHLICNQEVRGSNPCVGTNKIKGLRVNWIISVTPRYNFGTARSTAPWQHS